MMHQDPTNHGDDPRLPDRRDFIHIELPERFMLAGSASLRLVAPGAGSINPPIADVFGFDDVDRILQIPDHRIVAEAAGFELDLSQLRLDLEDPVSIGMAMSPTGRIHLRSLFTLFVQKLPNQIPAEPNFRLSTLLPSHETILSIRATVRNVSLQEQASQAIDNYVPEITAPGIHVERMRPLIEHQPCMIVGNSPEKRELIERELDGLAFRTHMLCYELLSSERLAIQGEMQVGGVYRSSQDVETATTMTLRHLGLTTRVMMFGASSVPGLSESSLDPLESKGAMCLEGRDPLNPGRTIVFNRMEPSNIDPDAQTEGNVARLKDLETLLKSELSDRGVIRLVLAQEGMEPPPANIDQTLFSVAIGSRNDPEHMRFWIVAPGALPQTKLHQLVAQHYPGQSISISKQDLKE